jgi:hypothetical protein
LDVAATSATLSARINPLGSETTCEFQYLTGASFDVAGYGSAVAVPCPGDLGAGETRIPVSVHVQGLAPSTVYHYRVIAANPLGTVESPDQTFTTQGPGTELALPDGRAWEMVSSPDKEGALIEGLDARITFGEGEAVQAAANGSAISYVATAPTEAEPQGNSGVAQDFSRRAPDGGWSTKDIALPNEQETGAAPGRGNNYRVFSSDLSLAIVQPFGKFTQLSPEASEQTAYLHTDFLEGDVDDPCVSGCFRPLVTGKQGYANVPEGTEFGCGDRYELVCGPLFVDATPDLSHVVLLSSGLTKTPVEEGSNRYGSLYEWSAGKPAGEQLQPLDLLPASEGGIGVSGRPIRENGSNDELSVAANQLADDGSVFFSYHGHLYLHDVEKGESVRLDVARGVAEPPEGAAEFLYASSDGSRVLFTDSKQLTQTAGGGVYECRIVEAGGALTCGELELTGLLVEGTVIGGSEDASYLYFASTGGGLYVDHHGGSGWTQTLIAVPGEPRDSGELVERTARVSPNGQWLAFMSSRDLTGYDTLDAFSEQPDGEVYLYDAGANRLVCASCNPSGSRPVGEEVGSGPNRDGGYAAGYVAGPGGGRWLSASIPGWTSGEGGGLDIRQARYLSDSGRLFFNSHEALVPQDDNGTWDVYEYEPPGVGGCTTSSATFGERSGGCVGLISSGSSAVESAFVEASEDGSDVFFLTEAQLAPQDLDTAFDIYDAHECTELAPCPATVTAPPPCDTGDACKPAPTPQPAIYGAPSSETFSGAGNVVPTTAPPAVKPKSLTRAQKLAKALKACGKRSKKRRAACERQARRAYGSAARAKRSRKGGR